MVGRRGSLAPDLAAASGIARSDSVNVGADGAGAISRAPLNPSGGSHLIARHSLGLSDELTARVGPRADHGAIVESLDVRIAVSIAGHLPARDRLAMPPSGAPPSGTVWPSPRAEGLDRAPGMSRAHRSGMTTGTYVTCALALGIFGCSEVGAPVGPGYSGA